LRNVSLLDHPIVVRQQAKGTAAALELPGNSFELGESCREKVSRKLDNSRIRTLKLSYCSRIRSLEQSRKLFLFIL